MKVSDILQTEMCNDNTIICIDKPAGPGNIGSHFKGNWYQDFILDYADDEITKLTYIKADNKIYMEVECDV